MADGVVFTQEEQHKFEEEASVYAIIRTVAQLEKAWINEKMDDNDYNVWCKRLITQYKALSAGMEHFSGLQQFMEKYYLTVTCRLAKQRLESGVSGIEASGAHQIQKTAGLKIAEVTQNVITAKDGLALGFSAVDQIQPLIQDIVSALSEMSGQELPSLGKMKGWLSCFANMRAHDQLSEEQLRQLNFDLDNAFNEFKQSIR